jgi:hypothetical protein
MLERPLRLLIDQDPGGYQVPANNLGNGLGQAPQLAANLGVQLGELDVVGQFGPGVPRLEVPLSVLLAGPARLGIPRVVSQFVIGPALIS